jgi:hypothetical protein
MTPVIEGAEGGDGGEPVPSQPWYWRGNDTGAGAARCLYAIPISVVI